MNLVFQVITLASICIWVLANLFYPASLSDEPVTSVLLRGTNATIINGSEQHGAMYFVTATSVEDTNRLEGRLKEVENRNNELKNQLKDVQTALSDLALAKYSAVIPNGNIPKVVHQTYSSTDLPLNYQTWRNDCISKNPEWEFKLWTDDDNSKLVSDHYPHLVDWRKVNKKKDDLVKLLYLHKFGGECSL